MADLRKQFRVETSAMAEIIPSFGPPIPCRLIDLSLDGARINVISVFGIPDDFDVKFIATGETLSARVVWRRPNQIGLTFV
ncbi:PilZ domain-containing protein [Methylobacterium sp. E-046]|uniref:PilZ domain-containing protein n=1 Tax=Methylobacterium sp. E-046 TaxID=2836576 RepID=UPI003918EA27